MCDECGAPDNECGARFNEFLVKEFEDPRYGKVHNLTVSAYMLQHSSKLTREGWLYECELLREFLMGDKSPEQIRHERQAEVDDGKRTFTIKSKTWLSVIPQTRWARTVMDVRLEDPVEYCEDVVAWATATLADAEGITLDAG